MRELYQAPPQGQQELLLVLYREAAGIYAQEIWLEAEKERRQGAETVWSGVMTEKVAAAIESLRQLSKQEPLLKQPIKRAIWYVTLGQRRSQWAKEAFNQTLFSKHVDVVPEALTHGINEYVMTLGVKRSQ